ncbi:MAG: transposase [Candidatus Aminicenantia bacterium]
MKGDFFHLLNRGVEKRKIFLKENDYLRFIHNLYDFNDVENVIFPYYKRKTLHSDVRRPKKGKKGLVDILCWCLMPNHPHIFAQDKINGGVSIFSKKIIGGYTKYFNEVNKREGVLFQGRTRIIKITRDAHFIHLPFYIMANPLDLIEPNWREEGIRDSEAAMNFLENFEYSSLKDLIGEENFPFVINKKLFYELLNTDEKEFKKDFSRWLKDRRYRELNFKEIEF